MFDLPPAFADAANMAFFTTDDVTAGALIWRQFQIPRGATMFGVLTQAAGGGGGGRHTGATNTNRGGGGGGGGGSRSWFLIPTIFLPSPTVQFRVGIGGNGGAATASGGQTGVIFGGNSASILGGANGFGGGAGTPVAGGSAGFNPTNQPQLR